MHYFNNIPLINSGIDISQETLELWYAIVAKYIEKKPDSKLMKIFILKQPRLANFAEDIVKTIDKLRKDDKVVEILRKVKEEIV